MSANPFNKEQYEQIARFKTNFKLFARRCVKIETKEPGEGNIVKPLALNEAQEFLDMAINLMLAELGWVRLIIVKGRQQGISTYIEARLAWLALFNPNTRVCILSHEAKSTAALRNKIVFAYENLPAGLSPEVDTKNSYELTLSNKASFIVLTAGAEESGRSQTAHHQHQSERAFFEKPDIVDAGAGQIVGLHRGTEIYKESTANGLNHFHSEVLDALAGRGIYRVVFIPWYWETTYRSTPRSMKDPATGNLIAFKRDNEEEQLGDLYGLDDEQIQWRRDKIVELKSVRKFKQEYPNHLMEAFQASGNSFYNSDSVVRAMKSKIKGENGALILGVDVGRKHDRTVLALRRGREIIKLWKFQEEEMDSTRLAAIIKDIINRYGVDKCFIDYGAGYGAIDILRNDGYRRIVEGINFGEGADNTSETKRLFLNKRAEMAFSVHDWLETEGEVSMPDDPDLAADFAAMPEYTTTGTGRIKFPSKDEIKAKFGRSPDILDAIMLTFARPVRAPRKVDSNGESDGLPVRKRSEVTSLNRNRRSENEPRRVRRMAA